MNKDIKLFLLGLLATAISKFGGEILSNWMVTVFGALKIGPISMTLLAAYLICGTVAFIPFFFWVKKIDAESPQEEG